MSATYRKPIQVIVANQLGITKAALPSAAKKFLREELFILNSEHIIKQRLGHSTYGIPKYFDLIEEREGKVLLPRGFLPQLVRFFDENGIAYEIVYRHPQFASLGLKSGTKLLPEQTDMVEQAFETG